MKTTEAPTLDELRTVTTTSIRAAGAFLGLSGAAAYRAANRGDLPTLSVGSRRRVPVPLLLRMVGLEYEKSDAPERQDVKRAVPSATAEAEHMFSDHVRLDGKSA